MAKQRFSDFSGGKTDFRFNTASNFAETIRNFYVLRDKSIEGRPGFGFWDIAAPRIPTNERISNIKDVDDTLCFFSNGRIYYNDAGFNEIVGPTGNMAFHLSDEDSMIDVTQYGDLFLCCDDSYSFPIKLFKNENGILTVTNAGLPKVISEPVITPSSDDDKNYIYAFVYEYEYRVGTTLFLDLGEPVYLTVTDAHNSFTGSATITDYLELTNGANRNYDEANIRKRIYRTQDNGTTFYLVGTIDNDVEVFVDNVNDDDLTANEVMYTQGGVKNNNQPPQCRYIASNNNIVYYANIIESAETKPYRLRFSKLGDPDSVPDSFFEDFESDITGIAAIDDRTVVFTEKKSIAMEGFLDDLGRGSIIRRTIADVGCVSNGSIVTTKDHIYWFSDSGIYKTNGVQFKKLTDHLDLSHQGLTNSEFKTRKIYGQYDSVNQRVSWCVNQGSADNDTIIFYNEVTEGFLVHDSGVDMSPTSVLFKDQALIRCDADGYVFQHDNSKFSDLVKSDTLAPADWWTKAIPYEWKHVTWTMGDAEAIKWVNKINIVGRPETNVYMEPRVYKEGSLDYYALSAVKFNPLIVWGDVATIWGDAANRWNSVDYLNQAKRMHRRAKRITHMQLSVASAYVTIQESVTDTGSYIVVDSAAKSASLVLPSVYAFGLTYEGYDLVVNGQSYQIQGGSESTLLLDDPDTTLIDGTYTYEIKGYPKAQRPQISDLTVYYEVFGDMDKLD